MLILLERKLLEVFFASGSDLESDDSSSDNDNIENYEDQESEETVENKSKAIPNELEKFKNVQDEFEDHENMYNYCDKILINALQDYDKMERVSS